MGSWWESAKSAVSSASSAASSVASKAKSGIVSASSSAAEASRRASASLGDRSNAEKASNQAKCMAAASELCAKGYMTIDSKPLFETKVIDVKGKEVNILTATELGENSSMEFYEQNYQAIRRALPSMGVKPSINDASKMAEYEEDMKMLTDLLKEHNIVKTTSGGRKSKRSGRKSKRSGRKSKRSGRKSKRSGRKSKRSGRKSKRSGRKSRK